MGRYGRRSAVRPGLTLPRLPGFIFCAAPNFNALLGHARTQSPQRTHSALLGVFEGSISALHARAHALHCVQAAGSKRMPGDRKSVV